MSLFYNKPPSGENVAYYDIVIVGGGMVGACLAALLGIAARQTNSLNSLKVAVLEGERFSSEWGSDFDPRVSALTIASQRILESVGAWPLISAMRLSPFTAMEVWDGEGTGEIQFFAEQMGESHLGHIIENRVTQKALLNCCEQLENVDYLSPLKLARIDRTRPDIKLLLNDGQVIYSKLLVGADGANSFVRRNLNFALNQRDYHHHALVTTVKTELSHGATARQRFTQQGPIAFLPLVDNEGGQHYSSIVWSTRPDAVTRLLALSDDSFCAALAREFEMKLGKVEWCDQRYSFPLVQRHVEQYSQENVVLVGDAAHTIHPLAGQGVNLGLMDAAVLAEELITAMKEGIEPGLPSVLRRYERRRKGPNSTMMAAMAGFKHLFGSQDLFVQFGRNVGLKMMNRLWPVKNQVMARAMGLAGDLPDSARKRLTSDPLY